MLIEIALTGDPLYLQPILEPLQNYISKVVWGIFSIKIGKSHDFVEAYQKAYQMLENKMAINYGHFWLNFYRTKILFCLIYKNCI